MQPRLAQSALLRQLRDGTCEGRPFLQRTLAAGLPRDGGAPLCRRGPASLLCSRGYGAGPPTAPESPSASHCPCPPPTPPRARRALPHRTQGGGGAARVRTGPGVAGGVWPNRCRAGGTEACVSRSKASVTDGDSGRTSSSSAGAGPLCPGPLAPAVTPSGRADAGVGRRLGGGDRGGGAAFPAADTHTLLCVSAQHLAVVQDAAAGVGRVPHAAGDGGGAGRGRLGPLPAEALARRGVARPLSYFLKRGIIEKLGPLLLLIPAFDRNCILEIIFFTF